MLKLSTFVLWTLALFPGAVYAQQPGRSPSSKEFVVDMGTSSAPAAWFKTDLQGAWPGLLVENTARGTNAQTQVFWKRWDAQGNPLVWQINVDVDDNRGFKGLFNMEAVDIIAKTVLATPISMARTGEVGIGTGTPVAGQQLTVGGDTRIRRAAGTAADGALILGSTNNVRIYGNSDASILSFYADGREAVRISGSNLLIGATTDTGDRLQVYGNAKVTTVQLTPSKVKSLPICDARLEGGVAAVTDADSTVFNAIAAGGGANHTMVFCNGAHWTVH